MLLYVSVNVIEAIISTSIKCRLFCQCLGLFTKGILPVGNLK